MELTGVLTAARPAVSFAGGASRSATGWRTVPSSARLAEALPLSGIPKGYVLAKPRFGASASGRAEAEVAAFEADFKQRTGFSLDPFQRDGVRILAEGKSPVVSAPTSSGKTLVAEAAILKALKSGKRVFYTTPRKAISNEKYHEFCAQYGTENVGLVTGDVSVNPDAPVVLMTTEIFRNMLYQPETNQGQLKTLQTVVFDECHFIDDEERGTVWEEALIYARRELPGVQHVLLSATIQNVSELGDWLNSLNTAGTLAGEYVPVTSTERPVPLTVQYLGWDGRPVNVLDASGKPAETFKSAFRHAVRKRKEIQAQQGGRPLPAFDPVFTVKALQRADKLPLIEFAFNRKRCEAYADAVLAADLQLSTAAEQQRIDEIIEAYVQTYPSLKDSPLLPGLMQGVAYHHADMWPREKELVEVLLKQGLLKAVFATTTLAEGVNVPAQTVGLSAYQSGVGPVSESAYQQMTGRAGRRGMFPRGFAVMSHPRDNDMQKLIALVRSQPNAVDSRFRITPYMALNHTARLRDARRIDALLESGFKAYQVKLKQAEKLEKVTTKRRKKRMAGELAKVPSPLKAEFKDMQRFLQATDYLDANLRLTGLGRTAAAIPLESGLIVAKALREDALKNLGPAELAGVLSATACELITPNQKEGGPIADDTRFPAAGTALTRLDAIAQALKNQAARYAVTPELQLGAGAVDTVIQWCQTQNPECLEASPGILIYTILRTANLLRHLDEALAADDPWRNTVRQARQMLLSGAIEEQIRPRKVDLPGELG